MLKDVKEGSVYKGDLKDGLRHGYGEEKWDNGAIYRYIIYFKI